LASLALMVFIATSKVVNYTIMYRGAHVNFQTAPPRSGSHPGDLPLDGGHLRLAVADLLLALDMLEAAMPV
jgi:hypothetical protein